MQHGEANRNRYPNNCAMPEGSRLSDNVGSKWKHISAHRSSVFLAAKSTNHAGASSMHTAMALGKGTVNMIVELRQEDDQVL